MSSYNKIILVGNLVRDPDIRYVGSGSAVTKFTLAVNRRTKKDAPQETDFIDVVAWDKLAETCNTYLKKGSSALVEGRLSIRSYETKEGDKRKATEVVCNVMQMLDRAQNNGGNNHGAAPAGNGAAGGGYGSYSPEYSDEDDALADEVPF